MDKFLVRKPNYDEFVRPDFAKIRAQNRGKKRSTQIKIRECRKVTNVDDVGRIKLALDARKTDLSQLLELAKSLKHTEEYEFGEKQPSAVETEEGALNAILRHLVDIFISVDTLEKTLIGKSVNALVRDESLSKDVRSMAKKLVKTWKQQVRKEREHQSSLQNTSTKRRKTQATSQSADKAAAYPIFKKPKVGARTR